jgi:cytochrome c2
MTLTQPGHPPFEGMRESGGRLAWLPDGRLLVTIGHHAMDGVNASAQASQDAASSFGKIIAINLEDGRSGIYSSGHRNPQGLVVSSAGQVWSTEHGPEGGDELNLIEEGGNYGWPLATYGTEYGTFSWPLAGETGTNGGFIEPYFSWVPSTGVSCLAEMTSPRFERWHGDLLACSLRDQAFWRLRVREGRVVMAERFPFGERIRDVVQGHDGSLVVWNDDRAIQFVTPADLDNGVSAASTFRICASCHVAPAGGAPAAAPSLVGIVGRKVASEADYEYSPALRGMGGNWTRERLDAFIADVSGFAPGTTMAFAGIRDAETRKALIDYLASPEHRLDVMPGYRTRVEGPQELK